MTFRPTVDAALIHATITHPRNWRWHSDTASPAPENWNPPDGFYIGVYDGAEYLGLFALMEHDADTWEIHTCLLPNAWGRRALQAYREGIAWAWSATDKTRIIGRIHRDNRLALSIAKRAGATLLELNDSPHSTHGTSIWVELRRESERESRAA